MAMAEKEGAFSEPCRGKKEKGGLFILGNDFSGRWEEKDNASVHQATVGEKKEENIIYRPKKKAILEGSPPRREKEGISFTCCLVAGEQSRES